MSQVSESGSPAARMTATTVLGWAWRRYSLYVDEYESEDSAIRQLGESANYGDCAPDRIEVWDDAGYRVIDSDEIYRRHREWSDTQRAEYAAKDHPKPVAEFEVRHPEKPSETAWLDSAMDESKAAEVEQRLRSVLGDRLIVRRPK